MASTYITATLITTVMLQKLQVDPADIIGEAVPLEDKISVVQGGDLLIAGAAVPRVSTDVRLYPGQTSSRRGLPGSAAKDGQPLYVEAPGTGRFRKATRDTAGGPGQAARQPGAGAGPNHEILHFHRFLKDFQSRKRTKN